MYTIPVRILCRFILSIWYTDNFVLVKSSETNFVCWVYCFQRQVPSLNERNGVGRLIESQAKAIEEGNFRSTYDVQTKRTYPGQGYKITGCESNLHFTSHAPHSLSFVFWVFTFCGRYDRCPKYSHVYGPIVDHLDDPR